MESENEGLNSKNLDTIDITKYPITTNAFTWTPMGVLLFIALNILSLLLPAVMIITFYVHAMNSQLIHWRILIIFIDIMAWWGLFLLCTLLFSKLFLIILDLIHKPKEGLFKIDKKDRDYYFFTLRVIIKKYVFWVWNNFCFPWASNLAFKICGMKADFKSTLFDGWSDVEFIEFGRNIMLGQGAVVLSSIIIGDRLLVKKVIIGDHVVIGGNAVIAPGTIIGRNSTIGVWCVTHINQVLEPDWIYIGKPARKYKPIREMVEESKKQAIRRIVDTNERIPYDVKQFVRRTKRKKGFFEKRMETKR
ncbi:MAG: acyltransferase [Promethearchaeota archaeon]